MRSSPFVDVELRHKLTRAILDGWEEVSKVIFWLSPLLAERGRAIHDGLALMLAKGFSEDVKERFKQIIVATPANTVRILRDDLASKKICPLIEHCFQGTDSRLQKHMMALFMAAVRPTGWYEATFNYINLLHPRSFYLGDMLDALTAQVKLGDLEDGEERSLKLLARAIISKREYAPKVPATGGKEIAPDKVLSKENKLPIDKLLKGNRRGGSPEDR